MVSIWFSPELTRSTEFLVTSEARGSWFGQYRPLASDRYREGWERCKGEIEPDDQRPHSPAARTT